MFGVPSTTDAVCDETPIRLQLIGCALAYHPASIGSHICETLVSLPWLCQAMLRGGSLAAGKIRKFNVTISEHPTPVSWRHPKTLWAEQNSKHCGANTWGQTQCPQHSGFGFLLGANPFPAVYIIAAQAISHALSRCLWRAFDGGCVRLPYIPRACLRLLW